MENEYDVNGYTDEQLFHILDLNNPSDRELEAKILSMVRKYANFGNTSGDKLSQFFVDIYNHFFEPDNDEMDDAVENKQAPEKEGYSNMSDSANTNIMKVEDVDASTTLVPRATGNGYPGNAKTVKLTDNLQLSKTVEYSKDNLNPLLKQTIKRIISIDSQYRNQKTNSPSTNFTFDLSEPLRDVVSLSLYSIQIPYTWYSVNSDFGGNFFYLKGNVPGINNGLHDYKISIPSGNYTPSGLATAVNLSIQNLAAIYTDASFGNTKIIYNNGITDQNSGNGKCTLQIDITKIYNEGNYSLTFPSWSTPLNTTIRLNTIAGYLGFNNQEYYCSSICSHPFFLTSFINDIDPINTSNTSFMIVPYTGNSYLTADVSYTPIIVSLDLLGVTQSTVTKLVDTMNVALKNTTKLDKFFTNCTLVNITNPLQYGNGNSYVRFNCKLNSLKSPLVQNLKLAAVFPYDPSGSIFYGTQSLLAFSDLNKDASENVICEFNEILSESPILQSDYDASNTSLTYMCDHNLVGYNNEYNNVTISIPNLTYPLNSFVNAVNREIQTNSSQSHLNIKGVSLKYDTGSSLLNISNAAMNNTYVNADYKIYATTGKCDLPSIFGFPSSETAATRVSNTPYNVPTYKFNRVEFNEFDKIYIIPISDGNKNTDKFIIDLNSENSYTNGANFAQYLYDKIANFKDPNTKLYPFIGSKLVYDVITGFTLTLNISLHLNQSFYKLFLNAGIVGTTNIWNKLGFDQSYNLIDYSNNNYLIQNKFPIQGNEITIFDGSNDTFEFIPSSYVDIFNTSNNKYSIKIKVPDNSTNGSGKKYAINELLNEINKQLGNSIATGTTFSTVTLSNGQTITKIKFNINQVFTTKDYNLVFYDPYSFTSCFSNSSKNTTTSIQNATWDTTLGWLLGYRNAISYNLADYVSILDIEGSLNKNIYYLKDSSNVCVFIGDTNVSTNLYNYFLIRLDDYVQNHLNDGLVTITTQETSVNHGPFVNVCDPVTGQTIARPADYGSPGITYTAQQLYAFNQQVQSQIVKVKSYSKGPFVQDIFGIIPVKTTGMAIGSVYVEFGGSLQNQQRLYFGPVNIHRMTIQLLNDRGNLVDLNNANWSFSFICEQLYKSSIS
jgi:hypothetical protein